MCREGRPQHASLMQEVDWNRLESCDTTDGKAIVSGLILPRVMSAA